jgi:hypothetical protein
VEFHSVLSFGIGSSAELGMPRNKHFLPRNNGNHSESIRRNFFGTKFRSQPYHQGTHYLGYSIVESSQIFNITDTATKVNTTFLDFLTQHCRELTNYQRHRNRNQVKKNTFLEYFFKLNTLGSSQIINIPETAAKVNIFVRIFIKLWC